MFLALKDGPIQQNNNDNEYARSVKQWRNKYPMAIRGKPRQKSILNNNLVVLKKERKLIYASLNTIRLCPHALRSLRYSSAYFFIGVRLGQLRHFSSA